MNKKLWIGLLVLALCMSIVFGLVTANNYNDISKPDTPNQQLSQEQKKYLEKVQEKIDKDRKDILAGFAIEENKYYKIEISKLDEFLKGEGIIDDTEITKSIVKNAVTPYYDILPMKSTLPIIYVSFDYKEVLFCYKEADGTNVIERSINENNKWLHQEKKMKGAKPAKIEIE